ncbi:unnamed protein product, partial [Ilex paraguariensis]
RLDVQRRAYSRSIRSRTRRMTTTSRSRCSCARTPPMTVIVPGRTGTLRDRTPSSTRDLPIGECGRRRSPRSPVARRSARTFFTPSREYRNRR